MFDLLEADIVVFQETKIQRKDLVDEMVLVPGWDCYWSLPRHKKGYSGVVIYTRQSVCAPIRAEEGITGVLCPPNSPTSFSEGPEDLQIGGYPTKAQLKACFVDVTTLDSEGRCVILEFPAFVLLGIYSPANRDETRDDFRLGFLDLLDARVRNLTAMGKRVILTGDLNISREEIDTANPEASMRKNGFTREEYVSTPARRMFNQLLEGGKVIGERDQGREESVLWDICRAFHPDRKGMFTCWEQKVNARPGNYGSRIDYVLSSLSMRDWFIDSNIQEGLMVWFLAPVKFFAITKDHVEIDSQMVHVLDLVNPPGMFLNGCRQREYSTKDMLSMSGKLIPEFDGRRNIRDMFARRASLPHTQSASTTPPGRGTVSTNPEGATQSLAELDFQADATKRNASIEERPVQELPSSGSNKRSRLDASSQKPSKRSKSGAAAPTQSSATSKGQQSLKGFLMAKRTTQVSADVSSVAINPGSQHFASKHILQPAIDLQSHGTNPSTKGLEVKPTNPASLCSTPVSTAFTSSGIQSVQASPSKTANSSQDAEVIHDPIESKESWSKLFAKPAPPRCEGHNEPCKTMLTKKNGMNRGRSFWMCARPLGPKGEKEKNTQWRCHTFIWCSDWNPTVAA
ncbi:MAG: hypothetical protein Q9170_001904 [Blastenia crenularia]